MCASPEVEDKESIDTSYQKTRFFFFFSSLPHFYLMSSTLKDNDDNLAQICDLVHCSNVSESISSIDKSESSNNGTSECTKQSTPNERWKEKISTKTGKIINWSRIALTQTVIFFIIVPVVVAYAMRLKVKEFQYYILG